MLLKRKDVVLRTFTENLMAYGLGRRIELVDRPREEAAASLRPPMKTGAS